MNKATFFVLLGAFAGTASASTVFSVDDAVGSIFTVTFGSPLDSQKGNELTGLVGTATFTGGTTSSATCTFGTPVDGCTSSPAFSMTLSNYSNQTSSVVWTITNLQAGSTLTSLMLQGASALTMFTPCVTTTVMAGNNCKDLTGDPSGTAAATGAVVYSDAYHLSSNSVPNLSAPGLQWDGFGTVQITFSGAFSSSETFAFTMDSDLVGSLTQGRGACAPVHPA